MRAGSHAGLLGAAALIIGILPLIQSAAVAEAAAAEYQTSDGYAFGRSTDSDGRLLGYTTTDGDGIGFWAEYQRLGGRAVIGAAISDRFACGETVCQAFERAVLRWESVAEQAVPVPVLDQVHAVGQDRLVQQKLHIPPPDRSPPDPQSVYDSDPGLRAMVDGFGETSQLLIGLPQAVADTPLGRVVRGTSGAAVVGPSGSAYLVGAGGIAVAAGLVPDSALQMEPLPVSVASVPRSLWIPRIGLNKPLLATDAEADGYLPPPSGPGEVVWYTSSALLNEGGSMVVAGHVDWLTGGAAFFHLAELQPGDEIWIGGGTGQQAQYQVASVQLDSGDSPAVRQAITNAGVGAPSLTLVTCGGPFDVATRTYLQRLVVMAQRIQ